MINWNNSLVAALLCLVLTCSTSPAYAGEKDLKRYDPISKSCRTLGFDSFWYGKGRRLFDQKCKTCHTRKNSDKAPFLYSESKPPKAWTRVFFTKYPKCAKTGAWQLTPNDALLINDYLYRYGANTHNANHAS